MLDPRPVSLEEPSGPLELARGSVKRLPTKVDANVNIMICAKYPAHLQQDVLESCPIFQPLSKSSLGMHLQLPACVRDYGAFPIFACSRRPTWKI